MYKESKYCSNIFIHSNIFTFISPTINRSGKSITLTKTNMLENKDSEYVSHFSRASFIKTLHKLIIVQGSIIKKKRKTALYCFSSIITCTRYPNFFRKVKLIYCQDPTKRQNQTIEATTSLEKNGCSHF